LILIVAPWSAFWERNAFAQAEALRPFLESPFVRGGVSGIGLITALAGLTELAGVFRRRAAADEEAASR
jgi:hypothetical protein